MADVAQFYDDLSAYYHLLFDDWGMTVQRQGKLITALLSEELGPGPKKILDGACGIGTQALGLAGQGHDVRASDLSPVAVARAKREAEASELPIKFSVADLRALSGYYSGPFDVVCAFDNALPHLEREDLPLALAEMASLLAPGGLLIASLRDYDALKESRPRAEVARVLDGPEGRRVVFQTWDWRHDGQGYRVNQYILQHQPDSLVADTMIFSTDYWCVTRKELAAALRAADLEQVHWVEPAESGYYQPIVVARRG
ncbi:MAG: class I SAM-dependent methyltransferase [Pseudomonadota bacterium]